MLDNDETSASTTEAVLFRDQHVEITKKNDPPKRPFNQVIVIPVPDGYAAGFSLLRTECACVDTHFPSMYLSIYLSI